MLQTIFNIQEKFEHRLKCQNHPMQVKSNAGHTLPVICMLNATSISDAETKTQILLKTNKQ